MPFMLIFLPRVLRRPVLIVNLLFSLYLSGCQTTTPTIATSVANTNTAPITASTLPDFPLLAPVSLGYAISEQQQVTARYGNQTGSSLVMVDVVTDTPPVRVSLLSTGLLGVRLFSVDYDGQTLKSENSVFIPKGFKPQAVLADYQISRWPLGVLQQALQNTSWQVTQPNALLRELSYQHVPVLSVTYDDIGAQSFTVRHHVYGYEVQIVVLPDEGDE